MPWQGVSIVDSRMAFVTEYLTGQVSMTELAAAYGVSRPTGYYWGLAPSAPDAAGDVSGGGGRGAAGPRSPSPLGRGQIAGVVTAARPRPDVAVSRHHPSAARAGGESAAPAAAPGRAGGAAASAGADGAERRLDGGFQRGIPHGRWPPVLSVDGPRRVQSVCAAVHRVAVGARRAHHAGAGAHVCGVWVAGADSE